MAINQEVKVEQEKYYTKISGQTNLGSVEANLANKVVAEYDNRNNNLRIYVYIKNGDGDDIIARAFYDDNNDGKVETYFTYGESLIRPKKVKRSFLKSLFSHRYRKTPTEDESLEADFREIDLDFRNYKRVLCVSNVLAGKKLVSSAQVLEDLFKLSEFH